MSRSIIPSLVLLSIGCATPGARPYDMSVAGHRNAAQLKEGETTEDAARQAADHRAAAEALVAAEQRACAGLSPERREASPFSRQGDIASVAPLVETTGGKVRLRRTAGAVVTLRAEPGMTAEWLQRIVDCHLAHNATLDVASMSDCPLVPRGAQARVTSTGNGFAVAIRSGDDATAREILARAQRLAGKLSAR